MGPLSHSAAHYSTSGSFFFFLISLLNIKFNHIFKFNTNIFVYLDQISSLFYLPIFICRLSLNSMLVNLISEVGSPMRQLSGEFDSFMNLTWDEQVQTENPKRK